VVLDMPGLLEEDEDKNVEAHHYYFKFESYNLEAVTPRLS